MRDRRWGTTPLLLLRISQLLLGVIVLGIAAYFVPRYTGWYPPSPLTPCQSKQYLTAKVGT